MPTARQIDVTLYGQSVSGISVTVGTTVEWNLELQDPDTRVALNLTGCNVVMALNQIDIKGSPVLPAIIARQADIDSPASLGTCVVTWADGDLIPDDEPVTPGTYSVEAWVEDSDGNRSLTLTRSLIEIQAAGYLPDDPVTPLPSQDPLALGPPGLTKVRAIAVGNLALTGVPSAQDGVTLVAGDYILLNGQSTGSQNGIWEIASGAWSRAQELPTDAHAAATLVGITEGTTYHGQVWVCTTDGADDVVGTDSITFAVLNGSGTVTSVTGTAPIAVASGTTTPVISISAATTGAAGSMSSADKTKLDGIEALADVTDAANVATALAAGESATSTATVVTGALLKNSGNGTYDHLGTADSPLLAIGIVLAGRTGAGAFTAQFRPGGSQSLLSDGTGTIAQGAFVIPSTTVAGRVKQGTSTDIGIVGINVGALVAATLDAAVTVR